jgi:hypothetical protein
MIRVRERLFAASHFGRYGHSGGTRRCPLLGVKRTSQSQSVMSAVDPGRTGLHANSNVITFAQYRAGNLQNVITVTESPSPVLASNALKSESQNTD